MPKIAQPVVVQHRIVEVEHTIVDAPEAVFRSAVQGPPVSARCACGEAFRADEVDIYLAIGEHMQQNL